MKGTVRVSYRAWVIAILLILLSVAAPGTQAQEPPNGTEADLAIQNETFELEVIRLVNNERISRGLHPLRYNSSLTAAARAHNQDMIANNFVGHTGSNGSTPDLRACAHGYSPYGWGRCYVGENIGVGYTTPAEIVQGWMSSSGHSANILKAEYREIGVGHNTGGSWGNYWTMTLGAQPNILPIFVNDDTGETDSCQVWITLTKENVSSWGSIGPITGVQISQVPDFAGATWLPWSQRVPFTLSPGNGTKTVYVRFKDNQNRTVTSSDTILLYEPVPRLSVSQNQITFLAELGTGHTAQSSLPLSIANTGGGTLHWTATDDRDWLTLDSTGGDAPATTNLRVNNSGGILNSLGTKTGTITVNATNPDAMDTPQTILVVVRVVEELDSTYLPLILH